MSSFQNLKIDLRDRLLQGLSEPEIYDDLMYKFRKIVGKPEIFYHFSKIIISLEQKGYNIGVIKQSVC